MLHGPPAQTQIKTPDLLIWNLVLTNIFADYQILMFTSAADNSIFASPCFIVVDKSFVKPKSNKIGWKGGLLLTRKFPTSKQSLV